MSQLNSGKVQTYVIISSALIATVILLFHLISGALMIHPIRFSLTLLAGVCLSCPVFAAPPEGNTETEILAEKIEDKLSEHKVDIAKSSSRLKRKLEKGLEKSDGEVSEDIEVAMDVLEEAFSEDGLFRNLAFMMGDFAEGIEMDSDGGETTISFEGAKIAQIKRKKSRDSEDHFEISGLGKNLTINREEIVEDGKSKTRIVIGMEIDGKLPEFN